MNLVPEFLVLQIGLKIQFTPVNIAMLIALALCVAIVWRWFKTKSGNGR